MSTKLDETMVMVLPRKAVEQIILGLYDPINAHLVKLVGFEFPPELRQHFRRELRSWLRKIERLRFKPNTESARLNFISICCSITRSVGRVPEHAPDYGGYRR